MRRYILPPALKHGAYSGLTVLPSEDPAAFEKLRADLTVEFAPTGPVEEDIVSFIARFIWRKQNLTTYAAAAHVNARHDDIINGAIRRCVRVLGEDEGKEQARAELDSSWHLIETRMTSSIDYLNHELSVMDRLDGMIDRCIKRLLLVRGVKSISASPPAAAGTVSRAWEF